jgi:hypothetical protein
MTYEGTVAKGIFGKGSKIEREATMINIPEGEYKLVREGVLSLSDNMMNELVGKKIKCEGTIWYYTLVISDWEIMD